MWSCKRERGENGSLLCHGDLWELYHLASVGLSKNVHVRAKAMAVVLD